MSNWQLFNSDCLDPATGLASLADKSVDHAIFDAPYSAHVHSAGRLTPKNEAVQGDVLAVRDLAFDSLSPETREAVASHCSRLVRRWCLAFCDLESAHLWRASFGGAGLTHARVGLWIKSNPQPQLTGDRPGSGAEAIVIAHAPGAGRWRWNGGGRANVWTAPVCQGPERVHTTQKPLDLMLALTRDFSDPGDLILDPFAGSGTGLVAAVQLGRRAIGFERDAKYHAVATKRLDGTREQAELFGGRKVKPKQSVLL